MWGGFWGLHIACSLHFMSTTLRDRFFKAQDGHSAIQAVIRQTLPFFAKSFLVENYTLAMNCGQFAGFFAFAPLTRQELLSPAARSRPSTRAGKNGRRIGSMPTREELRPRHCSPDRREYSVKANSALESFVTTKNCPKNRWFIASSWEKWRGTGKESGWSRT
jgi:hypothetical protein